MERYNFPIIGLSIDGKWQSSGECRGLRGDVAITGGSDEMRTRPDEIEHICGKGKMMDP